MPRARKTAEEAVKVDGLAPSEAQEITRIQNESDAIVAKAKEVSLVNDAQSEVRAAEFLKQVKMRIDIAETARTKLVKPLNDHVKMINAEFKKTTGPLSEADLLVRRGMTAYRNSQTFKEAEARRLEIEAQGRAAVREGDVETLAKLADVHAEALAEAPRKVETASGEARFRKVWKYEITDIEALPAGYWMPNEKAIKAAVEEGKQIPGVKSWQEETPIIV